MQSTQLISENNIYNHQYQIHGTLKLYQLEDGSGKQVTIESNFNNTGKKTHHIGMDHIFGLPQEGSLEGIKDYIKYEKIEKYAEDAFNCFFSIEEEREEDLKLRGGFSFNTLENDKYLEFSKSAPRWRTITQGLNLQGRCTNQSCEAGKNKDYVWIQKGIGKFNIAMEIFAKCPECSEKKLEGGQANNLGFWNCTYDMLGVKKVDNKPQDFERKNIEVGTEKFKTFTIGPSNVGDWFGLEVETRKR